MGIRPPRPRHMMQRDHRSPRRWAFTATLATAALVIGLAAVTPTPATAHAVTFFPQSTRPVHVTDPDTVPVELGMRFSPVRDVTVTGIRFYKGRQNRGPHTGTLWTAAGRKVASVTFTRETATGWQTATFTTPRRLTAGRTYIVSYGAPHGRYSADTHAFDRAQARGQLRVPAGAGVYSYRMGRFPRDNYLNSNYYVDVVLGTGAGRSAPSPTPRPSPTRTRPTVAPSPPATTPPSSPAPAPTSALPVEPPRPGDTLALPRVPWEGGPAYWNQFAKPKAAGWSDPSFFPIVVSFAGISSDAEAQYDKSLGINTYWGMWEGTPYSLFARNHVFWIGDKLNSSFTSSSVNWVGDFLDDEVDGRFTPSEGRARLQAMVNSFGDDGRFKYANFTQMVIGTDMKDADANAFVNTFTDAVSVDMYWYTIPYCDWRPYRDVYLTSVDQEYCRTASSYGKVVNSVRMRDAADGKLQPVWQFVELLNGGPGGGPFVANITPAQLKGAVMSSLINEARGILYFNQSLSGPCQSGNVVRTVQYDPRFCGAPQVAAVKQVNGQIKTLAPVLNTQSYAYSFGSGLDTMLKTYGGYAYVFAMVDGSSRPGSRTLTLPAGVTGDPVEVMFENRTLPVTADGRFTDTFATESTYHVYRVRL